MQTMRSLLYPPGRSFGTFAERSLVGTPTSYLLRSTTSSLEAPLVLRAAPTCGRARSFLGRAADERMELRGERTGLRPAWGRGAEAFFLAAGAATLSCLAAGLAGRFFDVMRHFSV